MKKRLDIQNTNVVTQRNRVGAPPREIPPEIERLMKSSAYWDAKDLNHRAVKEAVNKWFETATPQPEQASVVNSIVNGQVVKRAEFRPAEDPRFTSRQGTNPEDISRPFQGAN